ncbi:uncharacterized protein LOC135380897 [Ornithodoros turicata]|uniref:uncharacterized protein LOC135380897 n=1 Tax=Ornithodoros turicata TaxID=34597 RepID=UPI0031388C22
MAEATRVEFNEKLISLVEERPSLWDMRHKLYKNVHVKTKDWRTVAELLDATEKQVQARWRNLRDSYARIVRDAKGKSDDPAKEVVSTNPFRRARAPSHTEKKRRRDADALIEEIDGQLAQKVDEMDHFLLSLRKHYVKIPEYLQGPCEMHLLEVLLKYKAGIVPTTLSPVAAPLPPHDM